MNPNRRECLRSAVGGATLLSLSSVTPAFLTAAAQTGRATTDRRDTVLVVLQLSGGNDGLNTVVPYADDAYGRSRRTLRLGPKDVLKIDTHLGFHPQMRGFARLLKEGSLSVVQGVGYPKSDRSHPGAMRDWHTAQPEDPQCSTGWLGRAIDAAPATKKPSSPGLFVGPIAQPFAMRAQQQVVPSIRTAKDLLSHNGLPGAADLASSSDNNPLAEYVAQTTAAARATSRDVKAVLSDTTAAFEYPSFRLAGHLKTIAQLIRAEIGVRIFFAELGGGGIGGFDNHANQRDNHAALLRQLSESTAAFADDLARDGQLNRVLLMTFSEFGRTLAENGRRGTGHGAAQPVFLVGGKRKGSVVGNHPSLDDLDGGAPRHHTDFRRLYATVLEDWLGFDSTAALGKRYEPLALLGP